MVGRHSHPPSHSSNGGSSTRRRGQEEEREEVGNGAGRENGRQEASSDVDELVDSESERAEIDAMAKTRASATAKGGRGRGRGAGSARSVSGRQVPAPPPPPPSQPEKQGEEQQRSAEQSPQASPPVHATADRSVTASEAAPAPHRTDAASRPSAQSAEGTKEQQRSPRELLGRTATGGPVPYYYPSPNAAGSPRSSPAKKGLPVSTSHPIALSKTEPGAAAQGKVDDLTLQEVDKFLDLIEKHNLHTSNEDDMARSVTELYQEWLEWCAKRNIQSTKSKQALVAEFVRIHQGNYGSTRQARAMEIVQGSGNGALEGDGSQGTGKEPELGQRSVPPLISSKVAPTARVVSKYKEEERERDGPPARAFVPPQSATVPKRAPVDVGPSSHYIHLPSPSVAPRALTPGPIAAYGDSNASHIVSPAQLDSLHRRIREDVWRDARGMISQLVAEQVADLVAENNSMRGRVEQLEVHSDNLAQWIQHLNRIQDDLSASLRTAAAAPPPPPPSHAVAAATREEMMMEEANIKYGHGPSHPASRIVSSGRDRAYASPYPVGPPSTHSSPKRSYTIRRSPSPVMVHHASSNMPSRRLVAPPTRQYNPPPPPPSATYRDHARDHREINYAPTHNHRVVSSEQYERPYYTYPPDDRDQPLPIPMSPRQAKRARNGY